MNVLPQRYNYGIPYYLLSDNENCHLIDDYETLQGNLVELNVPERYHHDITGMVVMTKDTEVVAVWLSESTYQRNRWAIYRPLPYFKPKAWDEYGLSDLWMESNEEYWLV
jgi:hypothetical protein